MIHKMDIGGRDYYSVICDGCGKSLLDMGGDLNTCKAIEGKHVCVNREKLKIKTEKSNHDK